VLWRRGIDLVLKSKSKNHIDVEVSEIGGMSWRFTGIYGEPLEKNKTWQLMEDLSMQQQSNQAWLCAGDFNEILFQNEKEGGVQRSQACMDRFKQALEVCELHDLGFEGDVFTWRNKQQSGNTHIRERLDRAVANFEWLERFPLVHVKNGDPYHSDHRPVVITTKEELLVRRPNDHPSFKFEASWLQEEGFRRVVEEGWESMENTESLSAKVKGVAASLQDWNRNVLGDLEKRLRKAKKELEKWRRAPLSDMAVGRETIWSFKVDRLEEQIDVYWKQRAHVNWLHFGDRNTSYFHKVCSERRRRNRIGRLQKENGGWVEEEGEKKVFIANHFFQLFRSSRIEEGNTQQLFDAVQPRITADMNAFLLTEFSEEEVKSALDSIGDFKAPGPDGMPSIFYKNLWDVVGRKLSTEVLHVLSGNKLPEGWNDTVISLIPKTEKPERVSDLRPISLCNVTYKVVSKVLASRLRRILDEVINPAQSAFVPGRLISDNILVAYEITHSLLNKREGDLGYAALKLDMSKAYDRVEWVFWNK
jgi:hypothetical protein